MKTIFQKFRKFLLGIAQNNQEMNRFNQQTHDPQSLPNKEFSKNKAAIQLHQDYHQVGRRLMMEEDLTTKIITLKAHIGSHPEYPQPVRKYPHHKQVCKSSNNLK